MDDLTKTFDTLKRLIAKYHPPLVEGKVKTDKPQYHLWSAKQAIIHKKKKQAYFAGTIIQKGFVGFYYMPVYTISEMKKVFDPELLSKLKGKSCFHLKTIDANLEKQIKSALKLGFVQYRKKGWV
jgi:hypothetical protein